MNILIAPNSMKGSLNAFDFADAIEEGFKSCSSVFEIRKIPVADGGDFTGEILKRSMKAETVKLTVQNPFDEPVEAEYAIAGRTAIIEMANASGIKLIDEEHLNPLVASTYGTGQLIADAIEKGCNTIYLGVGGSATVDGGSGMAEALGIKMFNNKNEQLKGNGKNLVNISRVEVPEGFKPVEVKIISDVDNPLLGEKGAAVIFGPQKGATDDMVPQLENGLKNWARVLEQKSRVELTNKEGMGASGGIALPLVAFFEAKIVPGADFVLAQLNFDDHVQWADIVITGEGKIDSQTLNNKAPAAVAKTARKYNKPVFAIGGAISHDASDAFDGIFTILTGITTLKDAMKNSWHLVRDFSYQFAKTIISLGKI